MADLKSMTPAELTAWCKDQGQPAFRGKQIFQWFSRGIVSTEEMTNLPKALRAKIDQEGGISPLVVERKQVSKQDGTIKYLWRLPTATVSKPFSCAITTETPCVFPPRWGAPWAVPFVPLPWGAGCET